jgi:hypothetical protein
VNIPSLECANCGSKQIRRARYVNWRERLRGILGIHPFRCRKCGHRFLISVWLFGKLRFAKCPRCLGLELTTWSSRFYRADFLKRSLVIFGAQKYRCTPCRCNFVSFRPRKAVARVAGHTESTPYPQLDESENDDAAGPETAQGEIPQPAMPGEDEFPQGQATLDPVPDLRPVEAGAPIDLATRDADNVNSAQAVALELPSMGAATGGLVQQELVHTGPAKRKSKPRGPATKKKNPRKASRLEPVEEQVNGSLDG